MIDLTTINWDDVADLAKLDQAGFIPASGEGVRDYQLRVSLSMSALESLCKRLENDGIIDIDGTKMKRETLIPPEILAEGGAVSGRLYDFNIDWAPGFYLSEENMNELFVPEHFAHGYLVLEPSVVSYKCGEKFYGEYDDGIMYNDPDFGVEWPFDEIGGIENLIIADKDKNLQTFKEYEDKYLK